MTEIEIRKRTPEEIEEKLLEIITENVTLKSQIKTLNDQLDRELIKRARLEDRIKRAYIQFYDMFYHQLGYKYDFDETDLKEIHKLEELLKGEE